MKHLSRNIIIWLIVWIFATSSTIYAATTQSWTLGSLFEKISSNYFLKGDSIKQNTIDSSEIENDTLQWMDIKNETIESRDIKNWTVESIDLKDGTITTADIKNTTILSEDIKDNTIISWNIKNETIESIDIKNGTILTEDLKTGVIPTKLSQFENDITAAEVDPFAVKLVWDQMKKGTLQLWDSSNYSERQKNVIKFGGPLGVKIGEFEWNNRLTLEWSSGVNIKGSFFVNGKYYRENTVTHPDLKIAKYPSGRSRAQAVRVAQDGGLGNYCSNLSNANVKQLKLAKGAWGHNGSWYWGGVHYTSMYRLTWAMARELYEKDGKIIKSVRFGNTNYTDGSYIRRHDLRDGCKGDTIPFSTFNIQVEYKEVTTLVNLR